MLWKPFQKFFIVKKTNYSHKHTNIFQRILLICCCFIGKTIHQGQQKVPKMNNTPYFSNHTMIFCLKIKVMHAICNRCTKHWFFWQDYFQTPLHFVQWLLKNETKTTFRFVWFYSSRLEGYLVIYDATM